jgi:hypothetical protein
MQLCYPFTVTDVRQFLPCYHSAILYKNPALMPHQWPMRDLPPSLLKQLGRELLPARMGEQLTLLLDITMFPYIYAQYIILPVEYTVPTDQHSIMRSLATDATLGCIVYNHGFPPRFHILYFPPGDAATVY